MNHSHVSRQTNHRGWIALVLIVLLLGAAPANAQLMEWDPWTMDFGQVVIGNTEYRTLTLINPEEVEPLRIENIQFTYNQLHQFDFETSQPLPAVIPPGDSLDVVFSFSPIDFSFASMEVRIINDSTNAPSLFYSMLGEGIEADDCFPLTNCGGACVDVTNDVNNCGGCANFCPEPNNASALCETSNCGFACDVGYEPLGDECIPIGTSIVGLTNLLINYWYAALEPPPTIVGLGAGESAGHRRDAFEHMLLRARELVFTGDYENACGQLRAAYLKSDGGYPFVMPPDFVAGEATTGLSAHIVAVIEELDGLLPEGCPVSRR